MAVLSWGKPLIEATLAGAGGAQGTDFKAFPEIKENTAKLVPTKGNKIEAIAEGGDVVDSKTQKTKYALELEVFVKKGDKKPIEDNDGVITGNYSVRLTPEDEETEGFVIDNASVSCEESWSSADGKIWKYTFEALKPKEGKALKPYTKAAGAGS